MFESVIDKFQKYLDKMEAQNPPGLNLDLGIEVKKRLEQLDYLYNMIMDKHTRCMRLVWREQRRREPFLQRARETGGSIRIQKSDDSREIDKLVFEIEVHTESLYYLAGRMRTVLVHRSKPLPGLNSFDCEGARNVRNKLLEHAEAQDSRIFKQTFGVGGEEGPQIKVERPAGQENIFPDAGLEANATEIKNNLEKLLDRALS